MTKVNGRCSQIDSSATRKSPCDGLTDHSMIGRPSARRNCVAAPTSVSNRKRHITTADTSLTA